MPTRKPRGRSSSGRARSPGDDGQPLLGVLTVCVFGNGPVELSLECVDQDEQEGVLVRALMAMGELASRTGLLEDEDL